MITINEYQLTQRMNGQENYITTKQQHEELLPFKRLSVGTNNRGWDTHTSISFPREGKTKITQCHRTSWAICFLY